MNGLAYLYFHFLTLNRRDQWVDEPIVMGLFLMNKSLSLSSAQESFLMIEDLNLR